MSSSNSDAGAGDDGPAGIQRHSHEISEQRKKARDRTRVFVDRALEAGHDAMAAGDLRALADICVGLYDVVGLDERSLLRYDASPKREGLPWIHHAVLMWTRAYDERDHPTTIAERAFLASQYDGMRRFLSEVFVSIETATVVDRHVTGEFQDVQPVLGFESQLGERYLRPESSAGGTLQLRDPAGELKSVLCAGGKGSGKSTAVEALALDSYAAGHKVVDLVDFFKSENVTYDIPQQDNGKGLIETRGSMDLPTGYDDLALGCSWLFGEEPDDDMLASPDLEIFVPLTPGLAQTDVPTIPNVGETTVRPFTIPASQLTYRQLVMLLHHTTPARENHIRSAHQTLRDSGRDWTLADVAEAVRTRTNAGDKMADQIETSLRTAQSKSFIRDSSCPYSLEWADVMSDPDTITAFSVHTVQEQSDRLVVLSYLIDSLYEARRQLLLQDRLHEYPPLTTVMREMHEVAPRSTSEQDSESTIESYMIDTLDRLFALTRHADMAVIGDTQKFHRQLSPTVSGLFDHILAFEGFVPDVKQIFKTRVDETDPVERVAQFAEPGRCAFVSERGYQMPIQLAPGRSHHLEASMDGRGLGFRARVDETPERMLPAPWDASVPERLQFYGGPSSPMEVFFEQYITATGSQDDFAVKEFVTEAYNEWAAANGHDVMEGQTGHKQLHSSLKNYFGLSSETDGRPTVDGKRRTVHYTIRLDTASSTSTPGDGQGNVVANS